MSESRADGVTAAPRRYVKQFAEQLRRPVAAEVVGGAERVVLADDDCAGLPEGDRHGLDLTGAGRERGLIDPAAAEKAVEELLRALGYDLSGESLRDTPRRVAAAYSEMLAPQLLEMTTFPNDESYDELVVVSRIAFSSLCEHHLLPFVGVAHLAYAPGERIIGLSKLARVVQHYSRDLQVQERMTMQVARWLDEQLRPRGVGVILEAEHLCMSIRGVQAPGSRTTTSALLGLLRNDARTRQEFLDLVHS